MLESTAWIVLVTGLVVQVYSERFISESHRLAAHHQTTLYPHIALHPIAAAVLIPLAFLVLALIFVGAAALMIEGNRDAWLSAALVLGSGATAVYGYRWITHVRATGKAPNYVRLQQLSLAAYILGALFLVLNAVA